MDNSPFVVRRITLEQAIPVRLDVLRRGTPSQDANYDGDAEPTTAHIGAVVADHLPSVVATSTWLMRPWSADPTRGAVQLRGMAVLDDFQNTGVGAALIAAGIAHALASNATYVWAKARDSALYFYERRGFTVDGDQFMEPASGVPHHLVVLELRQ